MGLEMFNDSNLDQDVLRGKNNTQKLLKELRASTDFAIKRGFVRLIFDSLDFVDKFKKRAKARRAVETLDNFRHPSHHNN